VEDLSTKRFLLGILFAWAPWIPTIIGLRPLFRGLSASKATGVGFVAYGLGETFALWGIVSMVVAQILAIVWLVRSFSNGHWSRNLFSAFSIFASGLMLVLVCLFVASLAWLHAHS
jgi:hypothetical protein